MMRQSSSRIQRSKIKMKVKYALQFIVLLAISIWLLYQLKHSFDKKNNLTLKTHNSELAKIQNELQEMVRQDKIERLARKQLPEMDQNEEEKDREIDQLLEDERNGEEEYKEDEEIQMDNKEEKLDGNNSSIDLSVLNKNESSDANLGLLGYNSNSKGFVSSNQSVVMESFVEQKGYNKSESFEPLEIHGIDIEDKSLRVSNGTESKME